MPALLQEGRAVFLRFGGRRAHSVILAVAQDTIGVTLDTPPYPPRGTAVSLEIETPAGLATYYTRVIVRPSGPGEAMILMRAPNVAGAERRRDWRVPLNALTQFRRIAPAKAGSAQVLNVSIGGVLLETAVSMDVAEFLDIVLHLPEAPQHVVRGRIVRREAAHESGPDRYGVLFVDTPAPARRVLTEFIWRRLLLLYPREMAARFPGGKGDRKWKRRKTGET